MSQALTPEAQDLLKMMVKEQGIMVWRGLPKDQVIQTELVAAHLAELTKYGETLAPGTSTEKIDEPKSWHKNGFGLVPNGKVLYKATKMGEIESKRTATNPDQRGASSGRGKP